MTTSFSANVVRSRGRSAGRCPANSRWSCGNPARAPKLSCHTGQSSRSASPTSAAQPSSVSLAEPATIAGERAPSSSAAISAAAGSSGGGAGTGRSTRSGAARRAVSSAEASQSSMGTMTTAGPPCVTASTWARAIAPGTSWARSGCLTHTG